MDRPLSVTALRCRTSDRTPGGARGAEALALALDPDARLVGEFGEPRIAQLGRRPARLARLPARGRRAGRRHARRPARFPVLTASDCSICLTTLPGRRAPRAGRARAVARRARRLQHARHDAERLPRRHVPGRRVRALGRGLRARAIDPARVLMLRRPRPRPGRARAVEVRASERAAADVPSGRHGLRAPRPRRARPGVLPSQFAGAGRAERRPACATLLAEVARECDVVGLEVTAFEAPRARTPSELVGALHVRSRAHRSVRAAAADDVTGGSATRGGSPRWPRAACSTRRPRRRSTASRGSSPRCCTCPSRCSRSSPTTARCSRARSASATCARRRSRTRSARHVVDSGAPLEVVDARLHPKVRDNPAIEDFGIVAYLGMPLTTSDGERLGALCAIDHEPRQWTGRDHGVLEDLAGAAMAEVELRRANRAVAAAAAELHFAATHDTLTHLGNRRALLDDLGQLLRERRPATFALLDLHGMRGFNDAHGHIAGDELLASLGGRLETVLVGRRARLPARRRPAVRAADVATPRDAVEAACGALTAADHAVGCRAVTVELPREARSIAAVLRLADARLAGYGHVATAGALTSRNAGPRARLGGGEEKIARQHEAGQADRARADRAADRRGDVHRARHPRRARTSPQRAMDGREAPADGVITGCGHGRRALRRRRRLRLHGDGRLDGHDRRDQGRAAARAGADQADPDRVAARLAPARASRRRSARCSPAPATCSARRS